MSPTRQSRACLVFGMSTSFLQQEAVVGSYAYDTLHGPDEEVVRCAQNVLGFALGGGVGADMRDLEVLGVDADGVPDFERFGFDALQGESHQKVPLVSLTALSGDRQTQGVKIPVPENISMMGVGFIGRPSRRGPSCGCGRGRRYRAPSSQRRQRLRATRARR